MILIAVTVAAAVTVGVPLFQHIKSVTGKEPDLVVETVSLTDSAGFEVFANGVVEGKRRELPLRMEIVGRLVSVDVSEGSVVRQGDTLARLDSAVWEVELAKSQANRQRAQAEHELLVAGAKLEVRKFAKAERCRARAEVVHAKKTLDRVSGLATGRVITGQELDDKQAALDTSVARWEAATAKLEEAESAPRKEELKIALAKIAMEEAQVRNAQTMLDKTTLKAPWDAIVLRRRGEPGEVVGPESEEPLLVLADNTETRVRAFVEELDAMHIGLESRAYVQVDGMPDERFAGKVIQCAPYMVPKTNFSNKPSERVDVKVREVVIRLDDGEHVDRLVIGLPVEVYIERSSSSGRRPATDQFQMTAHDRKTSGTN
jgi:multidrug resistance efflux pump